ncbi:phage holin family protein, partial [Streptomyces sp. AS58]
PAHRLTSTARPPPVHLHDPARPWAVPCAAEALPGRAAGYPHPMNRLDQREHPDRRLADELAQVAREAIRDELRRQTREQRRTAALYAAAGAVALYAGAALALAVGLALAAGMPDWAAALITAVILGIAAHLLRGAARPAHGPGGDAAPTRREGAPGVGAYPPEPPTAPGVPTATGVPAGGPPPAPPAQRPASPAESDASGDARHRE